MKSRRWILPANFWLSNNFRNSSGGEKLTSQSQQPDWEIKHVLFWSIFQSSMFKCEKRYKYEAISQPLGGGLFRVLNHDQSLKVQSIQAQSGWENVKHRTDSFSGRNNYKQSSESFSIFSFNHSLTKIYLEIFFLAVNIFLYIFIWKMSKMKFQSYEISTNSEIDGKDALFLTSSFPKTTL